MNTRELDKILRQTLEDARLSRTERKALTLFLSDEGADAGALSQVRARAFDIASEQVDAQPQTTLRWLEGVVKATFAPAKVQPAGDAEAFFSPGEGCRNRIAGLLRSARRSVDLCVFTITDDMLSDAIESAHKRGVKVRVITDNDKAFDTGSDVRDLGRAGLNVRVDKTDHHMHHKFGIFDGRYLMTGSYNWTRSAFRYNEENIVVVEDARLIKKFSRAFEEMWERFA